MRQLLIVICGLVVMSACGGGGGGGGSTPAPPVISVSISPSTQSNIDQGQGVKFSATVENDSSAKGVTWSASGTGLTGSASGTFTNITTSTATYNAPSPVSANLSITVTATSVADTTRSSSAVVMVIPPPSITTTTLMNATPNANYSATLQATGGVGTLTWSLAGGALPTGLSLSSSGAISGDPTVSGTFVFTPLVTDSSAAVGGPATAQATLSLTVVTAISITTTSLSTGSEGITYLDQVDASGGTPPYAWSLSLGSLPPGLTMQPSSGVISGAPTSQGNFTFTVAAKDSSPTPQSLTQPLTIAIGAPGPLTITTSSLLDGQVDAPYTSQVAALGGTPPYTWGITTGALPSGVSLQASTGAISGTPSSTGTAYFTILVTDSSSQTQTQPLSIAVNTPAQACTSSGNNAVLSGPYAFSLSGYNDAGFLAVVGSFTADGTGKITAGEADTNGILGAQHGNLITAASSYSVGSDNRGCATLATVFGTLVTRFALGSITSNTATRGQMIEWDSPSASAYIAAGQILRQTSSTFAGGLAGGYVFHTAGWDTSLAGRDACVGVLSASGNTFYSLEEDCNDAWNVSTTGAPDTAGSYTALDANGRGTGIIALPETNSNITFYAVSGSQSLMLNADATPTASGELDLQNLPAGGAGFTQASVAGNMVFYLNGLSLVGTATAVSVETATADGSSSMAVTYYEDRAGTMQISGTYTCTYAVEPSGRVTLSSSTQSCGGTPPVFYLTDVNTGFIVDASPGVDEGSIQPQSAGPFTNASLTGSFTGGTAEAVMQSVQPEVEPVALDGSGKVTGITDLSSSHSQDASSSFLAATYSVNSDGTFSDSSSAGVVAGVIISAMKFVMFSPATSATSYPTLLVMQK